MEDYLYTTALSSTSNPPDFRSSYGVLPLPPPPSLRSEASFYSMNRYGGVVSSYSRPPLDVYGGIASLLHRRSHALSHQTDLLAPPRYGLSSPSSGLLPLPNVPPYQRSDRKLKHYNPAQSLRPIRKPFKQTRSNDSVQEKKCATKKDNQKASSSQGQHQRKAAKARKQGISSPNKVLSTRNSHGGSLRKHQPRMAETGNIRGVSTPKGQQEVAKTANENSKSASKSWKSQLDDCSLAKEVLELHSLFRTGVDRDTGKKPDLLTNKKNGDNSLNVAGYKRRKPEPQKKARIEAGGDVSKAQTPVMVSKKRNRRKNKKKLEKELITKKDKGSATPNSLSIEIMSREEMREAEASVDLHRGVSKSVLQFLGVTVDHEIKELDSIPQSKCESLGNGNGTLSLPGFKKEELTAKSLTPAEGKELEDKGFEFFSKLFNENKDLSQFCIQKKNSGTFECLICYSICADASKKFKNMMSLLMHASMREQNGPEHRGYGRALCSLLGWTPLPRKDASSAVKPVRKFLCPWEEDQEKQSNEDVTDGSGAQQTNKESEPGAVEALCESVNEPEQLEVLRNSIKEPEQVADS